MKEPLVYLPVKYYSFPLWKRSSLFPRNYSQARRFGAGRWLAIKCAVIESANGCTIEPVVRGGSVLDNLGMVIKLQ